MGKKRGISRENRRFYQDSRTHTCFHASDQSELQTASFTIFWCSSSLRVDIDPPPTTQTHTGDVFVATIKNNNNISAVCVGLYATVVLPI